jgi:UDP-N-acetylmuramoyl-L-alanyl-D-glutamate--2,6-diaminopimelate ligase
LGTGYSRPVDLVAPGDSAAETGRITFATVQMNLLLDEVDVLEVSGDPASVDVRTVEHDSRRVTPGALFCCLPGRHSDGHDHAAEAVARGAVGLVCEHLVDAPFARSVVQARVGEGCARPAMARLAAAFFDFPSRALVMAGVTGTNGKTTVTHLLAAVLAEAGLGAHVIGTLGGARTTPEATELQPILAQLRDVKRATGVPQGVAMEVSSHALAQFRVDGIHFDVAVFTNLSHDHLDFHRDMEEYFAAKASLFSPEHAVAGVVSADDEWGRRLLDAGRIPLHAVGRADASHVALSIGSSRFVWRDEPVEVALSGAFNVENALLAAEAAVVLGIEPAVVAAGLAKAPPVPGRFEVVSGTGGPVVVVDYAHTPASLTRVLAEARSLAPAGGRVTVVFGCGGDRDRAKRPAMGAAAVEGAGRVVLTTDNPRGEDPERIVAEVLSGVAPAALTSGRLVVEADRRRAIELAISGAGPGDVVLICGKGHETTQQIGSAALAFADRLVAQEVLGCSP